MPVVLWVGAVPFEKQSRWGGEGRGGNGGRRGREGVRRGRKEGDGRGEELDDNTDLEIHKEIAPSALAKDFSEGSLGCWTPRECLRETDRPC